MLFMGGMLLWLERESVRKLKCNGKFGPSTARCGHLHFDISSAGNPLLFDIRLLLVCGRLILVPGFGKKLTRFKFQTRKAIC